MKQNLYFLIESDTNYSDDIISVGWIEYKYISINNNTKMPYQKTSLDINNSKDLRFGDLFEIVNDKLILNHKYNEHRYDVVVVLDTDKVNQKLLVFGNKIGQQIIDKKLNTGYDFTFCERGDKLLIEKHGFGGDYQIVHNITQAKMKYDMKQMVK